VYNNVNKRNKLDSSNIKAYSPFQDSCKLKDLCFEIAYFSYTLRSNGSLRSLRESGAKPELYPQL